MSILPVCLLLLSVFFSRGIQNVAPSDPQYVLTTVRNALGAEAPIEEAQPLGSRGSLLITTEDGKPTKAVLVESFMGEKLRWDLQIAGRRWSGGVTPTGVWSKPDKKLMGFDRELREAVQVYKMMWAPDILSLLESPGYKLTIANVMPLTIVVENTLSPRKTEIAYSDFAPVGDGTMPRTIVIKYSDRPNFTLEVTHGRYFSGRQLSLPDVLSPFGSDRFLQLFADPKAEFLDDVVITKGTCAELEGCTYK